MKNIERLKIIKIFKSFCRNKDIEGAYQFLLKNKDNIYKDYISYKGINLLIIAIADLGPHATSGQDNFLNLIQLLIDAKVEINFVTKNPYHHTVLWQAIVLGRKNSEITNRLTRLLLDNNADVNFLEPHEENSPLMQAGCDITDIDVYKLILAKTKKEHINAPGPEDYYDGPLGLYTPAHWVCYGARIDFMNALVDAGGDFVIQDVEDCTAIEGALNLDNTRMTGPVENANTDTFNAFLFQHPSILKKEWERLENMKNDKDSPFLVSYKYEAHQKYHEYIAFLHQKLELEKTVKNAPSVLPRKSKI